MVYTLYLDESGLFERGKSPLGLRVVAGILARGTVVDHERDWKDLVGEARGWMPSPWHATEIRRLGELADDRRTPLTSPIRKALFAEVKRRVRAMHAVVGTVLGACDGCLVVCAEHNHEDGIAVGETRYVPMAAHAGELARRRIDSSGADLHVIVEHRRPGEDAEIAGALLAGDAAGGVRVDAKAKGACLGLELADIVCYTLGPGGTQGRPLGSGARSWSPTGLVKSTFGNIALELGDAVFSGALANCARAGTTSADDARSELRKAESNLPPGALLATIRAAHARLRGEPAEVPA